jgi:thioredoxin-related protein
MKRGTFGLVCLIVLSLTVAATEGRASSKRINWYSFEEGMSLGNSAGKKIFLNFQADWCRYCHAMEKETFKNRSVVSYLNENFIAIKVNYDRERTLTSMFRVKGVPDNWFFSEDGEVIGHRPGFIPPDIFIKILKSIVTGDNKVE